MLSKILGKVQAQATVPSNCTSSSLADLVVLAAPFIFNNVTDHLCFFKQAFRTFDKDNSGYITSDEVESVLTSLGSSGREDSKSLIEQYDSNHDGKIDYAE